MSDADKIPIDIHYNKLLDWLISRRHCQQQWQASALVVREKINNAIQDMPAVEEITKLLTGTYINYFHCLRIVELLKDTEKGSKNIFGRYSSQRMKDWQEIVKLYEKDGLYLAEAAQMVMRNVNYEIPNLKRQIAKCQQQQTDCTRKEGEHASQAAELRTKFQLACKNMGIKGEKVKKELLELAKDLPTVFDQTAKDSQNIQGAINYYQAFISFALSRNDLSEERVPVLQFLINKGNTTVYEWRTGKVPERVEAAELNTSVEEEEKEENEAEDTIDWGDLDGGGDEGDGIDWGDMNIEITESGAVEGGLEGVIEVTTESTDDSGVARGDDALTLLDNATTRNKLIDELSELETFLSQRLQEMRGPADSVSASQFQNAPEALHVSEQQVSDMLDHVTRVLSQQISKRMQDLLLIRGSPRYVDRLAENLKKISKDSEKSMAYSRLMVTRRQEAFEEQKQIEPKLDLLRKRTKELQKQISGEISKKYKDRPVNIMGEINTV